MVPYSKSTSQSYLCELADAATNDAIGVAILVRLYPQFELSRRKELRYDESSRAKLSNVRGQHLHA